ncbi:MAG: hypothetical protein K6G73_13540 [Marinilabiliaceae bacterium]|nr:hypothetical protein [Marinilabiliaceae bacterium]
MTQLIYPSVSKYDNALYYSLITAIDERMTAYKGTEKQLTELASSFHTSCERYSAAYKQSTKSFLTETIAEKDAARDKITQVIETVAQNWSELPDDDDALRGRHICQPFKDFGYRRREALLAQNSKWQNIAQVFAKADQAADLAAMGLTTLVQKANTLTQEIADLMAQRNEDQSTYMVGEMKSARAESESIYPQLMQYINAVLLISPTDALEQTAQYIQQDINKVASQYQQGRKHKKTDDGASETSTTTE